MYKPISRRAAAIGVFAGMTGAALLAACQGKTSDQLTADVQLIALGLTGIVASLRNLPPNLAVPADVLDKAQAAIDDVNMNAAAVGSSLTPNPDAIKAIATAVATLASLLAPFFPAAPIVGAVIQAALALVPTILAFIPSAPVPASAARASRGVTPSQARLVLQAAPGMLRG